MKFPVVQQVPLTELAGILVFAPDVVVCPETVIFPRFGGFAAGMTAGAAIATDTPFPAGKREPAATVKALADPLVNVTVPVAAVAGICLWPVPFTVFVCAC